jgi:hypothetical protein
MRNSSWSRLTAFALPLSIWAADLSPARAETVQECNVKFAICDAGCASRRIPQDPGPSELCKVDCAVNQGRCVATASDRNAGVERPPRNPRRDTTTVGPRPSILNSDTPLGGSSPSPTGAPAGAGARGGSVGQIK